MNKNISTYLPVTPATEAEMAKFPAYLKIVEEKDFILLEDIEDARRTEIAHILIAMGNGMLNYICAAGGDISISFPAFNHALELLSPKCDPYYQVMFQGAIGLYELGRKEEALNRLKKTLDDYLVDSHQSNPADLSDSPLSYALAAFWPAKSGGLYKITGIELFNDYALRINNTGGDKAEEAFWEAVVKNLPLRTYFTALQVHSRIRYASILLQKKEYSKAIFLLNEALYCYENGKFENYPNLVAQCEDMLSQFSLADKTLSSHLVSMVYTKPNSIEEIASFSNALSDSCCPTEEKIFSALSLCHSSDMITARTKQAEQLGQATECLKSALPFIESVNLGKAILGYYKLALCYIELEKDAEAAVALGKAIELHRKSPTEGNNLMHQAEKGTLAFNPFSKPASKIQNIYRNWRDTIATIRADSNLVPSFLFDEISNKISNQRYL